MEHNRAVADTGDPYGARSTGQRNRPQRDCLHAEVEAATCRCASAWMDELVVEGKGQQSLLPPENRKNNCQSYDMLAYGGGKQLCLVSLSLSSSQAC